MGAPCHSFAPNDPDFQSVRAVGDDRGDATLEEIDMINALIAWMQLLANRKLNCFKVGFEQAEVGAR